MGCRVVLIGGGSYKWTPTLARDLFLAPGLKGSELVLVDIDHQALSNMQKYCSIMADEAGTGWNVEKKDLDSALEGADFVCISISTGGLEVMALDYHTPEEFGIYHTVGDTVGPGGIMRTLRNIPVFLGFARKMEEICPQAWIIHVTNPLSQLTRAVCRQSTIKTVGLCHNFTGTLSFLASYLEADEDQVDGLSVGVNHFTLLKDPVCRGESILDRLSLKKYLQWEADKKDIYTEDSSLDKLEEAFSEEVLNYYLNFELFERFGVFPVGSSCHLVENLPYYANDLEILNKHHIRRKGVLPRRRDLKARKKRKVMDVIEGERDLPELTPSKESFAKIVESLHTGKPSRAVVAMSNEGQISNLPQDVVVETWAEVSRNGINPVYSGSVPFPFLGYMQLIIGEQEASVEAGIKGGFQRVVEAMALSPMVQNKDCAEELAERMLSEQEDLLPQF